ncbi:unnamed protein product [Owenia fusiformis]|uniref:Rieske domain-containing protein n=1 Tax=Owenia fusiformis TaxID=6347 RepID=A0A8S4MVH2_OWEFU|nr:unnamed protein product [Owenia fusiformis]
MAEEKSLENVDQNANLVGRKSDLIGVKRQIKIDGRNILFVHKKGKFFALDSKCYHSGGPLHKGDIEDVPNFSSCIVCPWHRYKICLQTGESVYQEAYPHQPVKRGPWKSTGVKQRTHCVIEREGNIYVQLSDLTQEMPSDHYNKERPPREEGVPNVHLKDW